ncbi:MAG: hypothetical protein ACI8XG_000459, partial [Congregibacter sp.]
LNALTSSCKTPDTASKNFSYVGVNTERITWSKETHSDRLHANG